MPRYDYLCKTCGVVEEVTRPIVCDDPGPGCCGGEMVRKITGVMVAPSAAPTRTAGGVDLVATKAAEKQKSRDMDAYKRLRRSGARPPQINGSAALEARAESKHEVSAGYVAKTKEGRKIADDVLSSRSG